MTAKAARAPRRASFRLTVQQQHPDGTSDTVMDAQGEAFIAIVGTQTPSGRIQGEHSHAGPDHTIHEMAHVLADTHLDHPR